MSLFRLHQWPHGLPSDLDWLGQATQIIDSITAQYAQDAQDQALTPEEHIRKVLAVPG